MNDISDLETRITTALERISTGLDAMAAQPSGDDEKLTQMQAALEEERTTNAQLEDRLQNVKAQQETALEDMRAETQRLQELLTQEEAALARLRKVNDELRANNQALREAAAGGVAEPHLINKAMMAELEGVRAAQAADRVELEAVLTELGGLIAESETVKETQDA
ncbi:hypothetical protein [Aliiroseovarius marinus]|uniref:hypothetical protein n=1 Tax=Aliiroseovarius marinus TaxID=2500159 RepID=UPI003D7F003C